MTKTGNDYALEGCFFKTNKDVMGLDEEVLIPKDIEVFVVGTSYIHNNEEKPYDAVLFPLVIVCVPEEDFDMDSMFYVNPYSLTKQKDQEVSKAFYHAQLEKIGAA